LLVRRDLRGLGLDCSGSTATEYALIAAAITGVMVAAVFLLGGKVHNLYNKW
jgi:Flp pilus assembly pilin Flp